MRLFHSFQYMSSPSIANAQDCQLQKLYKPHRHTEPPAAFQTTPRTTCVLAIALRLQNYFGWVHQESHSDWQFSSELQALYITTMPNQKNSGMALRNTDTVQHIGPHLQQKLTFPLRSSHDSRHSDQQLVHSRRCPRLQYPRPACLAILWGTNLPPGRAA